MHKGHHRLTSLESRLVERLTSRGTVSLSTVDHSSPLKSSARAHQIWGVERDEVASPLLISWKRSGAYRMRGGVDKRNTSAHNQRTQTREWVTSPLDQASPNRT